MTRTSARVTATAASGQRHAPSGIGRIAIQIPVLPHPQFNKADQHERPALYGLIAERVWSSSRLKVP